MGAAVAASVSGGHPTTAKATKVFQGRIIVLPKKRCTRPDAEVQDDRCPLPDAEVPKDRCLLPDAEVPEDDCRLLPEAIMAATLRVTSASSSSCG